jgi:hypothetical protein
MFAEMPLDNCTVDTFPALAVHRLFPANSNVTAEKRPNVSRQTTVL